MAVATPPTMKIPYAYLGQQYPPEVAEPILKDIAKLVTTGDFTLGAPVREFEERVAAFSKIPHVVGMSNGTDALSIALRAFGIGHGDEVITATNSFVASAGAIAMTGATPVLVDVDETYTISPEAVEAAITPSTKAIIPVHLTGTLADMPRIMEIAKRHGLIVIEDAAQAMGATLNGQHAGSWGDVAGVSLHPLKMLNVWGDGGICLTRDAVVAEKIRLLRNHGLETRDDAVCFGTNGRLSSLQAVVANHAILNLPWTLARRRAAAGKLTHLLSTVGGVRTPVVREGVQPSFATYIIRVHDDDTRFHMQFNGAGALPGSATAVSTRDALQAYLTARGIDAKIHYPKPIHLQTVGQRMGYRRGNCPEAERQADEILTLPLHEFLQDSELEYMAETIRDFYRTSPY